MTLTFIDRHNIDFLLNDWLKTNTFVQRPAFSDHSPGTFSAVLDLSEKLSMESFATHYKKSDRQEPHLEAGSVVLIPEIGAALTAFADGGFFAAPFPTELGGLQLPNVVTAASMTFFMAANIATSAYAMLTLANARLLVAYGSERQIEVFAKPQIEGRCFGTMCLSEPHAGSSLSDITTRATPDGTDEYGARYRLNGSKMWISGAEHNLSENIVHLVLAKVPGPDGRLSAGVKGISLFAVPKFLPGGERNDVVVSGLNHKMGYRGTVNGVLQFGDIQGAVGWRIGNEGDGLGIMFHMMNEARIMVGLGAAALASRGYRQSLDYAKNRVQGRISRGVGKETITPMVPIIDHSDVKRMLIVQKAYAEGALALVLLCASLVDDEKTHPVPDRRQEARDLLDLLTPVAKAWPSEFGLVANDLAIQIHGGYGYTRDFDVEQIYRDNRLNPIHEGTNGIQAIDLVGRKIAQSNGAGLSALERRIALTVTRARFVPDLAPFAADLNEASRLVTRVARLLASESNRPRVLQNASAFLTAFGHVVIAWIWLELALTASELKGSGADFDAFRIGKIRTCRYFYCCELPTIANRFRLLEGFDDSASTMPVDAF